MRIFQKIMKMRILLLFGFLSASSHLFCQNTLIPDTNFEQALIDLGYDTGIPNGTVPTANISDITHLVIQSQGIADLTGIEDFNSLEVLDARYNQINTIDVTQNISLTHLACTDNNISSIDVSQNPSLYILLLENNQLSSIDVSNNPNLFDFGISNNTISAIDLLNCPNIFFLAVDNNNLSTLDLTNQINLNSLDCDGNYLTSLDLSNSLQISSLRCRNNLLTYLNIEQNFQLLGFYCDTNQLVEIDISHLPNISSLRCSNNQLTCLNVKNGNNYSFNAGSNFDARNNNLTCIEVDDPNYCGIWWTNIDSGTNYSSDCNNACTTSISELSQQDKKLVKILDLMGREVLQQKNNVLIFIYDDGSSERILQFE